MRFVIAAVLGALALLLFSAGPAEAQFNPQGRSKKPKPAAKPAAPSRPRSPAAPTRPNAGEAQNDGRGREALIARYLGVALAQPGVEFPVQRLLELHRERDGNTDKLVAELEKRALPDSAERYAALLALALVERLEGRFEKAVAAYEGAAAERPQSPAADLALGRLHEQRGNRPKARAHFEKALERSSVPAEREAIVRALVTLALDIGDFDSAERWHKELVKQAGGSFYVRAELGRELSARGQYERAVRELRDVAKAAAGDHRVLAPALRDLGRALARAGQRKEALVELERALSLAGGAAGVRREVLELIAEVYRAEGRLSELVARLERTSARDVDELRLLAALMEESGRIDKALATYRQVLARDASDIATRLKVLSLLEAQGALDEAVREYEALIRAAPRNPDYAFRLAGALIQRGDRDRALAELARLEARSGNDPDTLAALVEYYERLGEKDRSLALLQRLAASGGTDPGHLVELGARYWIEGDKAKAIATWRRIRGTGPDLAQSLLVLGEVFLNHDLVKEALEALSEAVKLDPKQWRLRKAYALGLERAGGNAQAAEVRRGYHDAALALWEQILRDPSSPPEALRESRQHLVTLWTLRGQLPQRTNGLAKRFTAKPPDVEAGRLLAEAAIRARRYADAERTLARLSELVPGDVSILAELERALVLQKKLAEAIAVLERRVAIEPVRAREHFQRMAEYAAELYRDDDAVRYAARAVELAPDDASGHEKLGRMYRRRQENTRAIQAFRQAIAKNDRAFGVKLELAELLMSQGELEEADQLLRGVVRACPDDELVTRAARLAVQLNLGRGTLEAFEREVLPIALANPGRPLFRRLLVDIYGALAYPLLQELESGSPARAAEARAALIRIGERGVKPLLDALSDDRSSQQQVALTLLAHVGNKAAGPALVTYASGTADLGSRTRAMVAAGSLKDPALLPRFRAILEREGSVQNDDADPVVVAAAWGVARLGHRQARPLLFALLESGAPRLTAYGALGLGLLGDKSALPRLSRVAGSSESGNLARAAAVRALAMLGGRGESEALVELARSPDPTLRTSALLAIACLDAPEAPSLIADALLGSEARVRALAGTAAVAWSSGRCRLPDDPLKPQGGRVDPAAVLAAMLPGPYGSAERLRALERLAPELARAAALAAQSSPERASAVIDALGLSDAAPVRALAGELTGAELESARRAVLPIAASIVPVFLKLARHPYAEVRLCAVDFLGTRPEAPAREAIAAAVEDRETAVRRAALSSIERGNALGIAAAARLIREDRDWALRVAAAEALGRSAEDSSPGVLEALSNAALSDAYALVREASARALAEVSPGKAEPVLRKLGQTDPERRVRDVAWQLLGGLR